MAEWTISVEGLEELKEAIKRNPKVVLDETGKFLTKAIAVYKSSIIRNPWRIGQAGGGAPVATGNLRDTHQTQIRPFEAEIYPTSPYARYVHGDGSKPYSIQGLQLRPWLDYAMTSKDSEIQGLEQTLLENIVKDLSQ